MDEPFETFEKNGKLIELYYDLAPLDPRKELDHLGKMVCWHQRYKMGDNHKFTIEDFDKFLKESRAVYLPIYMYDHSGVTVSATPFDCPWDSGQLGFIYVTRDDILKEYGKKVLTKNLVKQVRELLLAEIKEYNSYLIGEVYGYTISHTQKCNSCGNIEKIIDDSCWGFYELDHMRETINEQLKSEGL